MADPQRVICCPRCGFALPPDTSWPFGHVCPAPSTTSVIAPGSIVLFPISGTTKVYGRG